MAHLPKSAAAAAGVATGPKPEGGEGCVERGSTQGHVGSGMLPELPVTQTDAICLSNSSAQCLQLGDAAAAEGKYSDAIKFYTQALKPSEPSVEVRARPRPTGGSGSALTHVNVCADTVQASRGICELGRPHEGKPRGRRAGDWPGCGDAVGPRPPRRQQDSGHRKQLVSAIIYVVG